MCTDVYKKKCVQEKMCTGLTPSMCTRKNGAAIKEFVDVYKMCTDVYKQKNGAGIKEFFDVYKMCTDVYRGVFF